MIIIVIFPEVDSKSNRKGKGKTVKREKKGHTGRCVDNENYEYLSTTVTRY